MWVQGEESLVYYRTVGFPDSHPVNALSFPPVMAKNKTKHPAIFRTLEEWGLSCHEPLLWIRLVPWTRSSPTRPLGVQVSPSAIGVKQKKSSVNENSTFFTLLGGVSGVL